MIITFAPARIHAKMSRSRTKLAAAAEVDARALTASNMMLFIRDYNFDLLIAVF